MSSFGVPGILNSPWVSNLFDQSKQQHLERCIGWRVDVSSPITISTSYRWIKAAAQFKYPTSDKTDLFALFPVVIRPTGVLAYNIERNGPALSRDSHEVIVPGDYGIFNIGMKLHSVYQASFVSLGNCRRVTLRELSLKVGHFILCCRSGAPKFQHDARH
jgi:hypothetical protein